jgi:hypothetical protein
MWSQLGTAPPVAVGVSINLERLTNSASHAAKSHDTKQWHSSQVRARKYRAVIR